MSTEEHSLINPEHERAALNTKITGNGIYWVHFF